MSVNQGIFWLSSYPKSGNTWFRIVLANALNQSQQALNINQINITRHASDRDLFVEALGFNSYLLSEDELLQLRPIVYKWYSQKKMGVQYFKLHDAYIYIKVAKPASGQQHQITIQDPSSAPTPSRGQALRAPSPPLRGEGDIEKGSYSEEQTPLVPYEGSLGALYFIRNPLDIAISFAHHSNISIDQCIDLMCDKEAKMFGNTGFLGMQVQQYLLSWSQHVQSWTSMNSPIRVMCLRYEDMHLSPLITFKKGMQFLNLDISDQSILTAIHHASFEKLQHQESEQSFREKPFVQNKFFRKGIIGDWEQTLNPFQIKKIIEHHKEVMFEYGYIDEHNKPIRFTDEC